MKFGVPMTRRSALKLAVAAAQGDRVQGYTMGGPFDLCDGRIAERVWLSS